MAHFAKLDENNVVTQVVVVSNDVATNEEAGVSFLRELYKEPTANWKQTSYNRNFRKNFAGVGCTYDPNKDIFILQKPWNGWILNETTSEWEPPTPHPTTYNDNLGTNSEGQPIRDKYEWNNETESWEHIPPVPLP